MPHFNMPASCRFTKANSSSFIMASWLQEKQLWSGRQRPERRIEVGPPSPRPSPRGEGEPSSVLYKFGRARNQGYFDWLEMANPALPLLGGEGRGEGGCSSQRSLAKKASNLIGRKPFHTLPHLLPRSSPVPARRLPATAPALSQSRRIRAIGCGPCHQPETIPRWARGRDSRWPGSRRNSSHRIPGKGGAAGAGSG